MVTEITVFECDSCGAQHENRSKITECCNCNCEICRACEEEEDLCEACAVQRDLDREADRDDEIGNEESTQ